MSDEGWARKELDRMDAELDKPIRSLMGVPARRPEDDALDRLERLIPPPHAALNRTEYQEAKTLFATVRQRLAEQDTEIQRLREERDAADKRAEDSHEVMVRVYARAEAAEAEVRQLREERDALLNWKRSMSASPSDGDDQ